MKKLILFLTLLFVGLGATFEANAQYSPSNNLNYIKLLKTPPIGSVEDSVMVYDSSSSFVKMLPKSSIVEGKESISNKTSTISGYDVDLYPNEKATHDALDLKLNISDLPTNLTLYPTTTTSDVSGYVVMVKDIHDVRYNSTAVDVSTPTITGVGQLVSQRITDAGVLIGQPGVFNITTFGNIRRLSGSGTATFYFEVYHRDLAGVETLICTSSISNAVVNGTYAEFTASGVWDDGDFVATDRIVIKSYANRIAGGSDPVYQFQFGGTSPVRTLLPVPFSVVDAGYELSANKQNSLAIDGTGTKYPTVDAVNAGLPVNYSKIVYVNATLPITATIFDTENPPVTNDNLLKNDVANLYIGTDASTWVYNSTTYVTKSVTATSSNFYLAGTTTDAGNTKTGHISRTGNITTTGKLGASGTSYFATNTTDKAYIGTSTLNPDTAKFVVAGTVSGTGSNYISSFLNNSGVSVLKININGALLSSNDIYANNVDLTGGGRFKTGSSGGLQTSTGKYFIETSSGWKSFHVLEYESVLASTYNAKSLVPKDYVDGKITQTITNGVTDKSPSEDAVFDAIDGVVKTIISDTPTSTNTGGVSEVLMHTYTIAGGKLPASCMPNLKIRFSKSGTAGTCTLRIKVNSVNDFATSTTIATYTAANTVNTFVAVRNPSITASTLVVTNSTVSLINDETTSTSGVSSITYDPSVTQYWFVSLQNADSTDTTRIRSIKLVN